MKYNPKIGDNLKKVLLFILILFMPFFIKAEEINFNWFNNFGGTEYDSLHDLIEIDDGFFALGTTDDDSGQMTNQDIWLIKYDFNGKELWSKKIGGSDWDGEPGLILTSDNNLVIYYLSWSIDIEELTNNGLIDFVVVKLDFAGNIIWQNNFGGNDYEYIYNFKETNDGGFVGVGQTSSSDLELQPNNGLDGLVFKFNRNGELSWFDTFGGEGQDRFYDVEELNDNSLIVNGSFDSVNISGVENNGQTDVLLVRYDENGNKMWIKTWGKNGHDSSSELYVYENKDIFLVGFTSTGTVDSDLLILKYDIYGNMLNQNSFGSESNDRMNKATFTKKGNLVILGSYYKLNESGKENYNDPDGIIGYLDNDGNLLWKKTIGGNAYDSIYGFFETENENIICYGSSSSTDIEGNENNGKADGYVVKYDKQGNLLWQHTYGSDKDDSFMNLIKVEGENFIVLNNGRPARTVDGGQSLVKYDKNGNVIWSQDLGLDAVSIFADVLILSNGDFVISGSSDFINLHNVLSNGKRDGVIFKYSIKSNIESLPTKNGKFEVSHDGNKGLIKTVPNDGYEVDKIIIKDVLGDSVAVTELENRTYSFNLYNDVSVEVLFKETLVNPKTGVSNIVGIMFTMILMFVSAFFVIKNFNNGYEL